MTLGQKITQLRKARGMTQEELSESVGVTRQTISKWELDTSTPDLDYLCKLCDLFGVTADYLIRPELEAVDAPPQAETTPPPPQTETAPTSPSSPSSAKTVSGTHFAGWALFVLGLVLTQIAILFILFDKDSTVLWLLAGIFYILGLELLFIRWKPLFIVMWTVWLIWSFVQFVLIARPSAVFAINLAFMIFALWVSYAAFCIGATVAVIIKCVRARRAKRS